MEGLPEKTTLQQNLGGGAEVHQGTCGGRVTLAEGTAGAGT